MELEGPDVTGRRRGTLGVARHGSQATPVGRQADVSVQLLEQCINVGTQTVGILVALIAGKTIPYSAATTMMVSVVIARQNETISKE